MIDEERETVLSLNDFHVPYHDQRAVDTAFSFAKYIKPHRLILHELLDWYSLSRFSKDPNRKLNLLSNHDKRLQKYLDSHAEELYNLDVLKIENL